MDRQPLRIAVIGLGWMGQAHSRSYARIPQLFEDRDYNPVLAVCADNMEERRDQAIHSFGFEDAVADDHGMVECRHHRFGVVVQSVVDPDRHAASVEVRCRQVKNSGFYGADVTNAKFLIPKSHANHEILQLRRWLDAFRRSFAHTIDAALQDDPWALG